MSHAELFVWVFLGHLVGDYWLQNDWMAVNKSAKGWLGHKACTIHVTLYTLAVLLFLQATKWSIYFKALASGYFNLKYFIFGQLLLFLLIAVPHWLIDRWSLAAKFMQWKNGVDPWKMWADKRIGTIGPFSLSLNQLNWGGDDNQATKVYNLENQVPVVLNNETEFRLWRTAFTALVYVVTDNTAHLLCLWLVIKWLL